MNPQDDNTKFVCFWCIGDHVLSDKAQASGSSEYCEYCGKKGAAKNLGWLADRIDEVVRQHFQLTPGYPEEPHEFFAASEGNWERRGELVEFLIPEIVNLDERIARDVTRVLANRQSYEDAKYGEENPYGWEAMYEERRPFDLRFRLTWSEFRHKIQSRSRFFCAGVEEMLADILGDLTALETFGRRSVIREINPDDQNHFFWRGRSVKSSQEIETILKAPAQELGPPPSKSAKAGRMNAQGISVFYGATEQSTCVSELRPLVGSSIVIGRFGLLCTVRLLDLGALAKAYVNPSYFDPEYADHKARAAFLSHLVSEISRPVLPDDEPIEYLPTQVLAEYLAQKAEPHFDGIIFPSSQTGGSNENVVLFNHSSRVEPYTLPAGSYVEIEIPIKNRLDEDDDFYDGIWVSETVPSDTDEEEPPIKDRETQRSTLGRFRDYLFGEPEDNRNLTLRLDTESVKVLDISAAKYKSTERSVTRHRQTEKERDDLEQRFASVVDFDLDEILNN